MKTGMTKNEYGTPVSEHKCDTCGTIFTVCPAVDNGKLSDNCLHDDCASYDPACDADVLFMSDAEIAKEKPLVHLQMLKNRGNVKRERISNGR